MHLLVKAVSGEAFDPIDVPDSATFSDVKQLLAARHNCAASLIRIIHQHTFPGDDTTLSSLGIVDSSTITVYLPKKSAASVSPTQPASPSPPDPTPPRPVSAPPPPRSDFQPSPVAESTASSTILPIDDPSLPDYVRHPVEVVTINTAAIPQLEEMGYPRRAVINALRYGHASLDTAGDALAMGMFDTERVNRLVEDLFIGNSGISNARYVEAIMEMMSFLESKSLNDATESLRQLFGTDRQLPSPQKVSTQQPFTIAEVGPFLEACGELTADDEKRLEALAARNPSKRGELRDLVVRVRTANSASDEDFRNPFAVGLGISGSVAEGIFGHESQSFAASLTTRQCRYLLRKMGEGMQFPGICETMQVCDLNLETVDEILGNDLQLHYY
jgi:hypothetical protein